MNETPIKYLLPDESPDLTRATDGSSGFDIRAIAAGTILPGQRLLVATGLHLDMPLGVEAQVRSRSGLAHKHGVIVLNAPGTIDADYRGEVRVNLINHGDSPFTFDSDDRIAQLVFAPVMHTIMIPKGDGHQPFFMAAGAIREGLVRVHRLAELSETVRGPGGFGSTGRG